MGKNLYPEYIKNSQSTIRKTNNLIKKWAKELNSYFTREDVQMANKHVKRYSTLFFTRECKLKPQVNSITLIRMAKVKKIDMPSVGVGVGQLELPYTAGGNVKWYSHFGKQFGSFLKF